MVRFFQPREKRKKIILWNMAKRGKGIENLLCHKISLSIEPMIIKRPKF